MADEPKTETPKPGHGGWVPKKKTPLWVALSLSIVASTVPVLAMPEFNWRVALAAVLSGFSVGLASYYGIMSAGPRAMVLLLCAIGLAASCSAVDPVLVTGESLKTAKTEYHATVQLMDQALATGLVTKEQYHQWRVFSDYFAVAFEHAVQLYAAAVEAVDANTRLRAGAIADDLYKRLLTFTPPHPGAPQ